LRLLLAVGSAEVQSMLLTKINSINGEAVNHGVAHCGTTTGGPCNESTGLAKTVALTDPTNWHTWRVQWDRTPSSWSSETITWYKDGTQFWQIKGSTVNDQTAWTALAHSSMYFIVNVAVGGYWVCFTLSSPFESKQLVVIAVADTLPARPAQC